MFEDLEPRPRAGAALKDLAREDLDLVSVEDLHARVEALEAEIARTQSAIAGKGDRKAAADALFGSRD